MQRFTHGWIGASAAALTLFTLIALPLWLKKPPADDFAGSAITQRAFPSLTYGIQGFFWWDSGQTGVQMDWVRMMSFSHIKQTFAWRDLEADKGVWDFSQSDRILDEAERRGLRTIARLGQTPDWFSGRDTQTAAQLLESEDDDIPPKSEQDFEDWANYCTTVATRYKGRIAAYQIWNEPNLSREWGGKPPDAAGYTRLLAACSTAIRAVDSDAILISAGLSPTGDNNAQATPDDVYLDAMYRAGFQQYIDVVGVHAPGFSAPEMGPDDLERAGSHRFFAFRRPEDLRKIMIAHGDAARQMAILEMGWTTETQGDPAYSWFAVSEEQQAEYLVQAFDYIHEHWSPWVGLVSVIYLPKPSWTEADEEYWWAISEPNFRARPAFAALVAMPKWCDDTYIPARIDNTEEGIFATLDTCP